MYMQARYYDPVIGRFYSNDPVGFYGEVDSFNRYSYVGNNPYKYTDPTGMTKESSYDKCENDPNCTNVIPKQTENKTWDKHTNDRILTLHPKVQGAATDFINDVESKENIKLRITQALRSIKKQDALYAQGRTTKGPIVTNAKGSESYHNYGLAIDVVEIKGNVAVWNTNWDAVSKVGISHGFTWGGNWTTPDKPHFQMTFGLTIKQLQQGSKP